MAKRNGPGRGRRLGEERSGYLLQVAMMAALCAVCALALVQGLPSLLGSLAPDGSTVVVLSAVAGEDGAVPSDEEMDQAVAALRERVRSLDADATVRRQGASSAAVETSSLDDAATVVAALGGRGEVEFVRSDSIGDADAMALLNSGTLGASLEPGTYEPFMDGSRVEGADWVETGGYHVVTIHLDDEGAELFADVSADLATTYGQVAVVVDGTVAAMPTVYYAMEDGEVSLTTSSAQEAAALAGMLSGGTSPVTLSLDQTYRTEPAAGAGALAAVGVGLAAATVAALAALAARHRAMAVVALAAAVAGGVSTAGLCTLLAGRGVIAADQAAAGGVAAACALSLASSALLLARLRSESAAGRAPEAASLAAGSRALRDLGAYGPVWLACAVALSLFGGPLASAGEALVVGVLVDALCTALLRVPLMRFLAQGPGERVPAAWGLSVPAAPRAASPRALAVAAALVAVACVAGVALRGLPVGAEVAGGARVWAPDAAGASAEEVADALADAGARSALVRGTSQDAVHGVLADLPLASEDEARGLAAAASSATGIGGGGFAVSVLGAAWSADDVALMGLSLLAACLVGLAWLGVWLSPRAAAAALACALLASAAWVALLAWAGLALGVAGVAASGAVPLAGAALSLAAPVPSRPRDGEGE